MNERLGDFLEWFLIYEAEIYIVCGLLASVVYMALFRFVLSDTSKKLIGSGNAIKIFYVGILSVLSGISTLLVLFSLFIVVIDILAHGGLSAIINSYY